MDWDCYWKGDFVPEKIFSIKVIVQRLWDDCVWVGNFLSRDLKREVSVWVLFECSQIIQLNRVEVFFFVKVFHYKNLLNKLLRNRVNRVDLHKGVTLVIQKRQGSNCEKSVEDIAGIARPVSETTITILAIQYVLNKFTLIYNNLFGYCLDAGQNPPGITNIGEFFGSAVEPSLGCLSFG